jgi:hypothetical protein
VNEYDADLFTINGDIDMDPTFTALLSRENGIDFADNMSKVRCKFDELM